MEQARLDTFLDEGWCLIGQLHRWLSNWPMMSYDRSALAELIRGLQNLWASAEDLGLKRLARTVLALEQVLERVCARSLAFTGERLEDVSTGIEGLQELLLGFELSREEPAFSYLQAILKMEHHARQIDPPDRALRAMLDNSSAATLSEAATAEQPSEMTTALKPDDAPGEAQNQRPTIELGQIKLLEQLAAKLDDTCHQLHTRILADQAPYQTTTSRLKHLSEETRELVNQIVNGSPVANRTHVEPATVDPRPSDFTIPGTEADSDDRAHACDEHEPDLSQPTGQMEMQIPASMSEEPVVGTESNVTEVKMQSSRVLILEASIFYRHLAAAAVRAAGFEPIAPDSIEQGQSCLEQLSGVGVIIAGFEMLRDTAEIIRRCQSSANIPVIALTDSVFTSPSVLNCEAHVPRKHPQKLVAVLEGMRRIPVGPLSA